MEGGKEALEDFAREAIALYGRDAPNLLLRRAEIAEEHGDELSSKTWRQVAAVAGRITRRIDNRAKPSSARPQLSPAPRRISESRKPSQPDTEERAAPEQRLYYPAYRHTGKAKAR